MPSAISTAVARPWRRLACLWALCALAGPAPAAGPDGLSAADKSAIEALGQQAYLKASNTGAGDFFGVAVAVSGNTAVVGAWGEDSSATGVGGGQGDNSAANAGAVYVFVRGASGWVQQAYLKASNTGGGDMFGLSVAIDGDTLVVGAPGEDSADDTVNGDQANDSLPNSGAAYVFVRNGSSWTQQAYLKASHPGGIDEFGRSVAVSGNTVVVGAWKEDSSATGVNAEDDDSDAPDSGAAYVFVRSGSTWSQQATLKASNTGAGDLFGAAVAISGNTVVIGAREEDSGAVGVGGNQSDDGASNAGAAYVFTRSGSTWTQQAYLKASHSNAEDRFGIDVAVSGDTLVVGANGEDSNASGVGGNAANNTLSGAGAAYVFGRVGATWSQQAYLKASNPGAGDGFGVSVAVDGQTVAVGAIGESSAAQHGCGDQLDNSRPGAGAVYLFRRDGTAWHPYAYVKASNAGSNDFFGWEVSLSGDALLSGAWREASNATGVNGNQANNSAADAGAAYVFSVDKVGCNPVVFVHGVAGSTLVDALDGNREIWVSPFTDRRLLSLYAVDNPPEPAAGARRIEAFDTVRSVELAGIEVTTIYKELLGFLVETGGYHEYESAGFPARRTEAGCDLSQQGDGQRDPTLFVFAYDWRRDNVESAEALRDFVACIRRFHPQRPVDILTHSMGGLVARRYLLDNPAPPVRQVVTIAAPWLGAAKPLNVLETGDFIAGVATGPGLRYAAPSLPAVAQLLASRALFELGHPPILIEDGWDLDGNGESRQTYSHDDLVSLLDARYTTPEPRAVGSTNLAFHQFSAPAGAQDDWRNDATGITYHHLYGVQAGNFTIAQVQARNRPVCTLGLNCRATDVLELSFGVGDETVPARSAGRRTGLGDYNAPGASVYRYSVSDPADNHLVEHTDLTKNPSVQQTVLALLQRTAAPAPGQQADGLRLDAGRAGAKGGLPDDETPSTLAAYYVIVDGAEPVTVEDTRGHSTAFLAGDLRGTVPGVASYRIGEGVEQLTLPVPQAGDAYRVSLVGSGQPIALEVVRGRDSRSPDAVRRWLDLELPAGVLAELALQPDQPAVLRADADGDGSFETLIAPGVDLEGPAAADVTAPELDASTTDLGPAIRVELSASDAGAGVAAIYVALDDGAFSAYGGPFDLDPQSTSTVLAFAEDHAGNRSALLRRAVGSEPPSDTLFANGFERP